MNDPTPEQYEWAIILNRTGQVHRGPWATPDEAMAWMDRVGHLPIAALVHVARRSSGDWEHDGSGPRMADDDEVQQGPATSNWEDTPLEQARRRAFDHPTQDNLRALESAAITAWIQAESPDHRERPE